jgi:hypothetical protein
MSFRGYVEPATSTKIPFREYVEPAVFLAKLCPLLKGEKT